MINKKDINKSAILASAEQVFQKWGFNKTTMDDIAEAAGRSKASLYYYYKDKDEILNIIISGYINEIISKSEDTTTCQAAVKEKFKVYLVALIDELKSYVTLFDIIVGEIKGYPDLIDRTRQKFTTETNKFLKDLIARGINSGEIRFLDKSSVDTVCYFITSFMSTLTIDLYLENKKINFKRKIDLFIEILFNGMGK
jgi:AcrR family transcriptional regulator